MTSDNKAITKKRKIRTAIFIVLTTLFTVYIFLFPQLWIFATIMALLCAVALIINLRLK
ncbi:MAG: hypothetical protein J0L62_05970 [Bacteroidetes bacterium]|nr:hypothetical protein [Bacteroidota bacterium]